MLLNKLNVLALSSPKAGDMLDWSIKAEGGEIIIIVKPIKVEKKEG